jgi:pimeloyl-ACP methyl ester carboxylesterase/predicted amino acid-binding ACT domain protein
MGTFQMGRHLERCSTEVDGRPVSYSVGGQGFPVVFLHGWGLAEHSYKRALNRLVVQGCRVYAPTLPGFGGSADLPQPERTIAGYAAWVRTFMREAGIAEPALVVGHSFGGGVAIKLAHDHPESVRYLVLMNSVGATPWGPKTSTLSTLNRPGWLWALRAMRDPLPLAEGLQVMRAAAEDLVPNLVKHPRTMLEVGLLARTADLGAELEELGRRQLPVLVLWGDHDRVLPVGSFEALCRAIGTEGQVVPGNHSWLLADPDAFGEVMSNVVEITARRGTDELHALLEGTSMPREIVKTLLADAAPLWLMSDPPSALAADLALCHPPLGPHEVRAVARATGEQGSFRLTVVAHDRPGLLADTAAVLAAEGLSVTGASATTWTTQALAMHALTVDAPEDFLSDSWDLLARRLRSVTSDGPGFLYEPGGRAHVRSTPQTLGRSLLSVTAPDQLGLLWRICRWLADNDVTIEACRVTSTAGIAHDEFVVAGTFDPDELAARLSSAGKPIWKRLALEPAASALGTLRARVTAR